MKTKRTEVGISAIGIGATDPDTPLQVVPAPGEPASYMLNPFRPEASLYFSVSILVLLADLVEMAIEDLMWLIPIARNVPRELELTDGRFDCHTILYARNVVVDSLPIRRGSVVRRGDSTSRL